MKLNNKGFAITAVLYGLLILFVLLVSSYLLVLSARKNRVDNLVKDIEDKYNEKDNTPSESTDNNNDLPSEETYSIKIIRTIIQSSVDPYGEYPVTQGKDLELEIDSESNPASYWENDSKCENGSVIEYISKRVDSNTGKVLLKFKIKNINSDDSCNIYIAKWEA